MNWTDIEDIAIELQEAHPDVDPVSVSFTQLRKMVESLEEFEEDPGHRVNEQILEAIQAEWIEENQDAAADAAKHGDKDDEDDEESGYQPNNPFR